jgi:hypothetical protein
VYYQIEYLAAVSYYTHFRLIEKSFTLPELLGFRTFVQSNPRPGHIEHLNYFCELFLEKNVMGTPHDMELCRQQSVDISEKADSVEGLGSGGEDMDSRYSSIQEDYLNSLAERGILNETIEDDVEDVPPSVVKPKRILDEQYDESSAHTKNSSEDSAYINELKNALKRLDSMLKMSPEVLGNHEDIGLIPSISFDNLQSATNSTLIHLP